MNCDDCQALLVEHLHRELRADHHESVDAHLATCGDCARAACRLRAELDDIAAAHFEEPPAALREALRSQVEVHFRPPWWKRGLSLLRRPVPAYGAVTLALVMPLLLLASPLASSLRDEPSNSSSDPSRPSGEIRVKRYDASSSLGIATIIF